jgi:hypothetical protein
MEKLVKINYLIICILLFARCAYKSNKEITKNKVIADTVKLVKNDKGNFRNCSRKDTIINDNFLIKYIPISSFYSIKLEINNVDTLLNYKFDCNTPRGLVPSYYTHTAQYLCLLRGSGQYFREFIITYVDNGSIKSKVYETAICVDLSKELVAYQDANKTEIIYVEHIKSGNKKKFLISKSKPNIIKQGQLKNFRLEIKFIDDSEEIFKLSTGKM